MTLKVRKGEQRGICGEKHHVFFVFFSSANTKGRLRGRIEGAGEGGGVGGVTA